MDESEDVEHDVLAVMTAVSVDIETMQRDIAKSVLAALHDPQTGMQEGAWERGVEWLLQKMFDEGERLGVIRRTYS